VYECVVDAVFPARSVTFTVNEWAPGVEVLIALPLATSPTHEAIPEPPASSAQAYAALTC
jgi:hypothetical protein